MIKGFKIIDANEFVLTYKAEDNVYTTDVYTVARRVYFNFDANGHKPSRKQVNDCRRALSVYEYAKRLVRDEVYCNVSAWASTVLSNYNAYNTETPFSIDDYNAAIEMQICPECGEELNKHEIETSVCTSCGSQFDSAIYDYAEVLEWYAVSEYLGKLLIDAGHIALETDDNWYLYGRTCSGQEMLQDGVMQDCAAIVFDRTDSIGGKAK